MGIKRMGEVDGKEVNGAEEVVFFFPAMYERLRFFYGHLFFFFLKLQPGVDSIQSMA
jgi:hypothetical protein